MTKPTLKLSRLPDRTPVKINLHVDPELHRDLEDYACVYRAVYGDDEKIPALIPFMLRAFIESDAAFKRARKEQSTGDASPSVNGRATSEGASHVRS